MDKEQHLVKMMEEAMFGSGVIKLETEVMTLGQLDGIPVWLNVRWPTFDDEETMMALKNIFLRGLAPEQVSVADANLAAGRAMIEQLAVKPYPEWLTRALTDKPVKRTVGGREVEEFRPDTNKLRSRPLVQALWLKYVELYNRFHSLSLRIA